MRVSKDPAETSIALEVFGPAVCARATVESVISPFQLFAIVKQLFNT
jgi:hypothetical protein